MSLNFLTLYGSVRTERQGIKFARFLDTQLRKRGHASTLIDPLQYRVPLLDKMFCAFATLRPTPRSRGRTASIDICPI